MLCSCDSAVDADTMDIRKLKEGNILKYKSGFLGSKWKIMHAVLFSDSRFCWYEEKGDRKPKGSVLLKDVMPYICVGLLTDRMPVKRPSVPEGHSVHHLVGIGMDPRAETVHWVLFSSDSDIESWFTEITKTLPKPNPPPPQDPQSNPQSNGGNGGYVPPPKYPDAPPPIQSGGYPQQPAYRPTQPAGYSSGGGGGYTPQPSAPTHHTTVIVRDGGGYGGGYGGSTFGGGSGLGFGSGMLAGSLLGYGLGSMWGGHSSFYPSYGFGGFGGGHGLGGGYYSDNDTNITNNYYNYGDGGGDSNTRDAGQITNDDQDTHGIDNESSTYQDDNHGDNSGNDYGNANEDYGGGGYEDYGNANEDYGGGMDYGGDDFGGGDFGGGDFGGGDFGGDFGGGDF